MARALVFISLLNSQNIYALSFKTNLSNRLSKERVSAFVTMVHIILLVTSVFPLKETIEK